MFTHSYSYDACGNAHGFTPDNAATKLLYAGEFYDSTATQYYLRARWYSPITGRFNRMDPFAGSNQDPQSLHKYLYAHCNPINSIDPTGYFSMGSVGIGISIAAVIINISLTVYSGIRHNLSAKLITLNVLHNLAIFVVIAGAMLLSGPVAFAAGVTLAIVSGFGLYNLIREWNNMDGIDKTIAFAQILTYMAFAGGLAAFKAAGVSAGNSKPLNWTKVVSKKGETRIEHVRTHNTNNPAKPHHGVFNGDGVDITNAVWNAKGNTGPTSSPQAVDVYILPKQNAGTAGGFLGDGAVLNHVTIITQKGTPNIITSYPSPPPN